MDKKFADEVQVYVARYSVSASAARGQGSPGLVSKARAYLGVAPLRDFGVKSPARFSNVLDHHTLGLKLALPPQARSWGVARKLLNIFLRNAFYTTYLCDRYHLDIAEWLYEVPLDRIVGRRLMTEAASTLPRWPGVKHLTPAISVAYQTAARRVAENEGFAPVHLDVAWWGGPR
jgi:hypothetical protein